MRLTLLLLSIPFLLAGAWAQEFNTGKGILYIAGGGTQEPKIFEKFVELAGGSDANIVVIPTASTIAEREGGEDIIRRVFREYGKATQITIVHTRDSAVANSEEFVAPVLAADAVWLWGGQARRFTEVYMNTRLANALQAVHQRGGLIGGTSSGAVVLSDLIIRPGDTESSAILKKNNIKGLGLLQGVLLDVHAIARNRIIPMTIALPDYPERVAISIDENTALILTDDVFEVYGRSYVVVYNVEGRDEPYLFLSAGDQFSLKHNMMTAEDCSLWTAGCIKLNQ